MKQIEVTEIVGIKVGHAQDITGGSGCTVILCENGAMGAVDVRGSAPATKETDLLRPENMINKVFAVMLSGGSAYGLDACSGAMKYLEEKKCGFDVGIGVVPIVCGASLFDLTVGDSQCRPDSAMGYRACQNADAGPVAQGNVGAGTGASVGKYLGTERMMKGGFGAYGVDIGGVKCGALVAVNALGDIFDVKSGRPLAGLLSEDRKSLDSTQRIMYEELTKNRNIFSGNTTLGCIVTNAKLSKAEANKLASVAHNGYAMSIRPAHTSADGDAIFVLSTGEVEAGRDALGMVATEVMALAVGNAVKKAKAAYGLKCAADFA